MSCRYVEIRNFKMYCSLTGKPTVPHGYCDKYEPLRQQSDNEYDRKLEEYKKLKEELKDLKLQIYLLTTNETIDKKDEEYSYIRDHIAARIYDIKNGMVVLDFSSPAEAKTRKIKIPKDKEQEIMELWNRVQEIEQKIQELDEWLSANAPIE